MNCIGVVVTYNRKELLIENLKMLFKQTISIDKILIIDNHSTDGTKDLVNSVFKNNNLIDYRYMDQNYGGAGGFYYGVKYARDLDYDLIWLMDDDGRPYDEFTFENLIKTVPSLYKKNKLLFLNSFVTFDGVHMSFNFWPTKDQDAQLKQIESEQKNGILYNRASPFNGTMITKELVDVVGYPRKEFFMSRDETDYKKRSIEKGALVATIISSVYYHPSSKLVYKRIGNISTQIYDNLDKEYYFVRNLTFTYKKNKKIKIIGFAFLRLATIMLYENNKIARTKQVFYAISDGINNKMGKRTE